MKKRLMYPFIGIAILGISCQQILLPDPPPDDPKSLFDQCWTFADQEYSFFELKEVDWQKMRAVYEPLITKDMSDQALFDTLAAMLFELRDGHVNLFSPFDISRNWQWNLDYPSNFDFTLLERNYWNGKERLARPFITYDFGDIGYVYYSSFSNPVSDDIMSVVIEQFKDHKGLIIDVRNNGGGSLSNVSQIVKRCVEQQFVYGQRRRKNGPAHDAFTAWEDLTISPKDDLSTYKGKIAVLSNRSCYSSCNDFVAAMSALPQVTIIGDHSGGGGGVPSQTQLSNGWTLRVSSSQTVDHLGISIEEGVSPDIKVNLQEETGKDEILEEALALLRRGG